eukprot:gene2989-4080_t
MRPIEAMHRLIDRCLRNWPLVAALSSALMLAIAHAFETFGGLAPCTLCLKAREVYWVALAIGLGQRLEPIDRPAPRRGNLVRCRRRHIHAATPARSIDPAGLEQGRRQQHASAKISTIPICPRIQHAGLTPIGPK